MIIALLSLIIFTLNAQNSLDDFEQGTLKYEGTQEQIDFINQLSVPEEIEFPIFTYKSYCDNNETIDWNAYIQHYFAGFFCRSKNV